MVDQAIDTSTEDKEINDLLEKSTKMWQMWAQMNIVGDKPWRIEFAFDTTDKKAANRFSEYMKNQGHSVDLSYERVYLIFKVYKIEVEISKAWSLDILHDEIKRLYKTHAEQRILLYDIHTGINEWSEMLQQGFIVKMTK